MISLREKSLKEIIVSWGPELGDNIQILKLDVKCLFSKYFNYFSLHVCVYAESCGVYGWKLIFLCTFSEFRIFFFSFSYFIILGNNGIKFARKAFPWLDVTFGRSCQKEINNNNNPQQIKKHNCMLASAEKCSFDSTEFFSAFQMKQM